MRNFVLLTRKEVNSLAIRFRKMFQHPKTKGKSSRNRAYYNLENSESADFLEATDNF